MNIRKIAGILLAGSAAAAAGGILGSPKAAADDTTTTTIGQQAKLVNGAIVQGWTINGLKPSSDVIPYSARGTLWEATATNEAIQGSVMPIVSNLNARSASGDNYRVLYGVAAPQGINPSTIPQGQKSMGKVYFDVTDQSPDTVVYSSAGNDLLIWKPAPVVQPSPQWTPPSTGGAGTQTAPAAPAPAAGSPGAPQPAGSQGTPLPASTDQAAPAPAAGGQGTPLPAGQAAPAAPAAPAVPAPPAAPAPAAPPAPEAGSQGTPMPGDRTAAAPTPAGPAAPTAPAPAGGSQGTPLPPENQEMILPVPHGRQGTPSS